MTNSQSSAQRLEGVDNFRDYGGFEAEGGRRLKHGRLFRSAHHGKATEEDLAYFSGLGVSVIVDLRRPEERLREPSRRWAPFNAEVIDNDMGRVGEDDYLEFLKTSDLSVQSMRDFLMSYYRDAPFEPRHIDLYSRYFRALGQVDAPVLIHCAAGKDRTGILAALTHQLLGVAYEDSVADYMLTNDPDRIERRLPLFAQYVFELTRRRPTDDAMRTTMGVEALYLECALDAVRARHGSVKGYLKDALGVDDGLKAKIQHHFLD